MRTLIATDGPIAHVGALTLIGATLAAPAEQAVDATPESAAAETAPVVSPEEAARKETLEKTTQLISYASQLYTTDVRVAELEKLVDEARAGTDSTMDEAVMAQWKKDSEALADKVTGVENAAVASDEATTEVVNSLINNATQLMKVYTPDNVPEGVTHEQIAKYIRQLQWEQQLKHLKQVQGELRQRIMMVLRVDAEILDKLVAITKSQPEFASIFENLLSAKKFMDQFAAEREKEKKEGAGDKDFDDDDDEDFDDDDEDFDLDSLRKAKTEEPAAAAATSEPKKTEEAAAAAPVAA